MFLTLQPGCCQCGTDPELITDLAELGLILFASNVTVIVAGQCRFRLRQYEGWFSSSQNLCCHSFLRPWSEHVTAEISLVNSQLDRKINRSIIIDFRSTSAPGCSPYKGAEQPTIGELASFVPVTASGSSGVDGE